MRVLTLLRRIVLQDWVGLDNFSVISSQNASKIMRAVIDQAASEVWSCEEISFYRGICCRESGHLLLDPVEQKKRARCPLFLNYTSLNHTQTTRISSRFLSKLKELLLCCLAPSGLLHYYQALLPLHPVFILVFIYTTTLLSSRSRFVAWCRLSP